MRAPYHLVVEPQELAEYAAVVDPQRILVLPFSELGQGSIPARNWVWEHSLAAGHARHWILDDNLRKFYRLNNNRKTPMATPTCFRILEDFVDRYENIALAGMQYEMFAPRKKRHPAYLLNTRIYSCILIDNSLDLRWRGKYNEDTDLSLRALGQGYCTFLSLAFLADKQPTMRMSGGNTDELYQGDGRREMAESLQRQHPELVTVTRKWGRWQHQVDYSHYRKHNRLRLRAGVRVQPGVDEYNLVEISRAQLDELRRSKSRKVQRYLFDC